MLAAVEGARNREYLAECLWPGVTEAALAELDARARVSAESPGGTSSGVRYLGSMLMPADEVVFFVFGGPSADAVRAVAERAAIPFERIVESVRGAGLTEKGER